MDPQHCLRHCHASHHQGAVQHAEQAAVLQHVVHELAARRHCEQVGGWSGLASLPGAEVVQRSLAYIWDC
jgi:hypothetical protein